MCKVAPTTNLDTANSKLEQPACSTRTRLPNIIHQREQPKHRLCGRLRTERLQDTYGGYPTCRKLLSSLPTCACDEVSLTNTRVLYVDVALSSEVYMSARSDLVSTHARQHSGDSEKLFVEIRRDGRDRIYCVWLSSCNA